MMMMRTGALALGVCATLAAASPMSEWNLIVRTDVVSTSEVDGSALIGGNLTGTSNYAVQGVTAASGLGLAVGGNIVSGNIQVNNGGDAAIAGTVGGPLNLNGGQQVSGAGVGALVADVFAQLEFANSFFATLPTNGVIGNGGALSATPADVNGALVAVYSFSSDDLQGLGQVTLSFGAAEYVVINVSPNANGIVDFVAPPNILDQFNQANSSRILWNITADAEVRVGGNFHGALLAPYSDLRLLAGNINGTVVVDRVLQQDAEIRRFTFGGEFFPVPTPASAALLAAGLLVAAPRRR